MDSVALEPTGLYKKLSTISMEMGKLPKSGYNSFHKYKYVTESDAMDKFRGLCYSNGVIVIPSASTPVTNGDLTCVDVTYKIIDVETGQHIDCMVPGQGQDKGDKGIYKALTGSFKYFILKTFLVPSGDDPERDDRTTHEPAWKDKDGAVLIEEPSQVTPRSEDPLTRLKPEQQRVYLDIVDKIVALVGTKGADMEDLLEMVSEYRDPNDMSVVKKAGVKKPLDLKYFKVGKANLSQAEFTLINLNKIADKPAAAKQLEAWRAFK